MEREGGRGGRGGRATYEEEGGDEDRWDADNMDSYIDLCIGPKAILAPVTTCIFPPTVEAAMAKTFSSKPIL